MDVKIRKTAASSTPNAEPPNSRTKPQTATGKNPTIGTDWKMSSVGRISRRAKADFAAR